MTTLHAETSGWAVVHNRILSGSAARKNGASRLLTGVVAKRILLIMLGVPIRDRRSERREATRREVVDAAWVVARDEGLAQVTLRAVAERVGMRAPSLYSHFASKHAIYDAMFAGAWIECGQVCRDVEAEHPPQSLRDAAHLYALTFFDFCVFDLARFQLMNQRTIPGFEPSPESYAPAVAVLDELRDRLASFGITRSEDIDLYTALIGGLIDAQLANDPGGDRWRRLLDRAIDMYVDDHGSRKAPPHKGNRHGT